MLRALGTILKWVILLPILAAIVLLAVANDQRVAVHLNPFDSGDPLLRFDVPLYQIGFALFALGVVIGGLIVWVNQLRQRRRAGGSEASLWQARGEGAGRRDGSASPALPPESSLTPLKRG